MPFAKINHQEIFFEDSGGNGPVIVFMHGFLMDQSLFDGQVAALAPRYRCIRWDARCFGKTVWDEKPFNLYHSVKDCFGLMDFLGIDSAILVGMSQGGYCALRAAITSPERVNALVLMSTQSAPDSEPLKAAYREMRDTWKQVGPISPLLEGPATAILGPKQMPGIENYWNAWIPKWKQISGDAFFHAMNNLLDRDDVTQLLSKIHCSALVTHGKDDSAIPEATGKELCAKLSGCKGFVVSPGAHAVNLTHSEVINPPLLKFLDGLTAL